MTRPYLIFKRLSDLFFSLALFTLFLPLIIATAILLILSGHKSPFFLQKRPGMNGEIFSIIKFKTMTDQADIAGNLLPDEKRLTPVGKLIRKLSLDELPQLLNVFKGDMSIVGPRPLLPEYLNLYTREQARRHEVRPGITGWAQVNGRNAISWEEKFKYDVWYVDHQSFYLDLKIIIKTFVKVIMRDGINEDGKATTTKFKGRL
ncbi:sugar transferase [Croceiramulus getboli]|nr:sugar transferase [Flavobacteriaceae bacterium YJPT1-3]